MRCLQCGVEAAVGLHEAEEDALEEHARGRHLLVV